MRSTMTAGVLALLFATTIAGAPLRGGMIGTSGGAAPELTRVSAAFAAAMRAGDAKAVAAVFAEDGTDMPPGAGALRGRTAIEAYYRGLFATCRFAVFDLLESDGRIAGDLAYLAGVSRVGVVGPGTAEATGKFLVILKRSSDAWRVLYAIHNDDVPAPRAAAAAR